MTKNKAFFVAESTHPVIPWVMTILTTSTAKSYHVYFNFQMKIQAFSKANNLDLLFLLFFTRALFTIHHQSSVIICS
jgi:hypothetical protein